MINFSQINQMNLLKLRINQYLREEKLKSQSNAKYFFV